MAKQINRLPRSQVRAANIFIIQKNYPSPTVDASIAIVQSIYRSVELIVAANCHHQKLIGLEVMLRQSMNCKNGAAAHGFKYSSSRSIRQIKAAGPTYARVV